MPHLTKFADPSVMKTLLSERLPLFCPEGEAITSCHVQQVRYSPKKKPEHDISLPKGLDGAGDIRSVDVSGINYHPGQRCTIRYDLYWGTTELPQRLTLFGKTYRGAEGHDVFARSEYLWNHCSGVVENVLFAQPFGYTSAVQTLWQLGIEGVPLRCVVGENNCDAYLRMVAKGLAMIQDSGVAGLPKWRLDEYLAEADKKIEKLCRAAPMLVEALNLLAQRIHRDAPIPSDIPLLPMYGEFHIEQLLAQDGKIAFIDFDEFALGTRCKISQTLSWICTSGR